MKQYIDNLLFESGRFYRKKIRRPINNACDNIYDVLEKNGAIDKVDKMYKSIHNYGSKRDWWFPLVEYKLDQNSLEKKLE